MADPMCTLIADPKQKSEVDPWISAAVVPAEPHEDSSHSMGLMRGFSGVRAEIFVKPERVNGPLQRWRM